MAVPVPIVERGGAETVTGLGLTFVAVTNGPRPGIGVASLIALDGLAPVAHLRWDIEEGEVYFVLVDADRRRKGIASVLWTVANEVAADHGWPPLRHSAERSLEGDEWAAAVGGDMPPLAPAAGRPYADLVAEGRADPV